MSDPRRLVDEGASAFERELLSAWQHEQPPDRARHRALALAGAGAATTLTAATTAQAAATAAPKASLALALTKWLGVGFVAGLATSGVALHYADPLPAAPRTVQYAAAPAAPMHAAPARRAQPTLPAPPVEQAAPTPAAAFPPRHEAHASPQLDDTGAAPDAPHGSLGPETAALDRARAALESGQPAQALALVADYQRRFPDGMLSQEAAVLRIDALEKQGNRAQAVRQARRFLVAHPDSPHAERLERLTVGTTNP